MGKFTKKASKTVPVESNEDFEPIDAGSGSDSEGNIKRKVPPKRMVKDESDNESDAGSDASEAEEKTPAKKGKAPAKGGKGKAKAKEESEASGSESEASEDEEPKPAPKKAAKGKAKAKVESEASDSESEPAPKVKGKKAKGTRTFKVSASDPKIARLTASFEGEAPMDAAKSAFNTILEKSKEDGAYTNTFTIKETTEGSANTELSYVGSRDKKGKIGVKSAPKKAAKKASPKVTESEGSDAEEEKPAKKAPAKGKGKAKGKK